MRRRKCEHGRRFIDVLRASLEAPIARRDAFSKNRHLRRKANGGVVQYVCDGGGPLYLAQNDACGVQTDHLRRAFTSRPSPLTACSRGSAVYGTVWINDLNMMFEYTALKAAKIALSHQICAATASGRRRGGARGPRPQRPGPQTRDRFGSARPCVLAGEYGAARHRRGTGARRTRAAKYTRPKTRASRDRARRATRAQPQFFAPNDAPVLGGPGDTGHASNGDAQRARGLAK